MFSNCMTRWLSWKDFLQRRSTASAVCCYCCVVLAGCGDSTGPSACTQNPRDYVVEHKAAGEAALALYGLITNSTSA